MTLKSLFDVFLTDEDLFSKTVDPNCTLTYCYRKCDMLTALPPVTCCSVEPHMKYAERVRAISRRLRICVRGRRFIDKLVICVPESVDVEVRLPLEVSSCSEIRCYEISCYEISCSE